MSDTENQRLKKERRLEKPETLPGAGGSQEAAAI
jgi:hypothetical protein